jgi:hypothetical protein
MFKRQAPANKTEQNKTKQRRVASAGVLAGLRGALRTGRVVEYEALDVRGLAAARTEQHFARRPPGTFDRHAIAA